MKDTSNINQKGVGLGLSICKKITEFMGGGISLRSQENKGSVFQFKVQVSDVKLSSLMDDSLVLKRQQYLSKRRNKTQRIYQSEYMLETNPFNSTRAATDISQLLISDDTDLQLNFDILVADDNHFNFLALKMMLN